jgi:hypothetical protein
LQIFTNQLPDAFNDSKKVTKTNVPAANAPIKVDVPVGQTNEIIARMKRGRLVGSKEKKNPRKRKGAKNENGQVEDMIISDKTPEENQIISNVGAPAETQVSEIHENEEILINYIMNGIRWNRDEIDINDNFANNIALNIINSEDHDLKSIEKYRRRNYWPK